MIHLAPLLWQILSAHADPGTDLASQRQRVDQAASEVARARAEGSKRDVAERLAIYRTEAALLERLVAQQGPPPGMLVAERRIAVDALRLAWAEGRRDEPSHELLLEWLDPPDERLPMLRSAYQSAMAAPPAVKGAILLDVIEQADALSVLLAFDAAAEEAKADQLELRASSIRRRGPGQTATVAEEIEAVQASEQAAFAEKRKADLLELRSSALSLRQQAVDALGER